jgi:hypothetical protein
LAQIGIAEAGGKETEQTQGVAQSKRTGMAEGQGGSTLTFLD